MKKISAMIATIAICLSMCVTNVFAQIEKGNPVASYDGDRIILSDGKEVTLKDGYVALFINGTLITDYEVVISKDRALVPLRLISEQLGAIVEWKEPTKEVVIKKSESLIVLKIDSDIINVNGKDIVLDCPAILYKDLTYAPLRFLAETLDATVIYSPALGNEYEYYYDTTMPLSPANTIIRDYPNIIIDEKYNLHDAITKEEALQKTQKLCLEGLINFDKRLKDNLLKSGETPESLSNDIKSIENEINRMMYLGDISRYYKYTIGPYDILFDKFNGKMFFIMYSSGIKVKAFNVDDKSLYMPVFIIG